MAFYVDSLNSERKMLLEGRCELHSITFKRKSKNKNTEPAAKNVKVVRYMKTLKSKESEKIRINGKNRSKDIKVRAKAERERGDHLPDDNCCLLFLPEGQRMERK